MTVIYKNQRVDKLLMSNNVKNLINMNKNQEDIFNHSWFKGSRNRGLR